MRIELSKTTVEFTPEADYETTMLEGLWRMLVDCARFNQKLVPVGEYVPEKNNIGTFLNPALVNKLLDISLTNLFLAVKCGNMNKSTVI